MSISLSNPKTFLPLLLFIGFVFALIGLGSSMNSNITTLGLVTICAAVVLWVLFHRGRIGF